MLQLFGLCAAVTALFSYLQLSDPSTINAPLRDAELYVEDWFLRNGAYAPLDPRLVLVGIDRPSYADAIFPEDVKSDPVLLALREGFPWSRRVWAALIERLGKAGAQAIVLDLVFADESDGDAELRRAGRVWRPGGHRQQLKSRENGSGDADQIASSQRFAPARNEL